LAARRASAWHTTEQRITDATAYTLRARSTRVGIWKAQYSVWDPFTVGTYIWPWLFRVANLHLKWRFYQGDPWAFAVGLGVFRLDTARLKRIDEEAGHAVIVAAPAELLGSYRLNETYTLSSSLVHTTTALRGELNRDDFAGAAEGAVDNLQFTATFEWRFSRVLALTVHGRYLVFQRGRASANAVLYPDEFTTVEVEGSATTDELSYPQAFSVVPALVWSWQTFNLRAGLGYGNYNISGINFVLPNKTLIPELDLYWIF
jgi:hypothetical protein